MVFCSWPVILTVMMIDVFRERFTNVKMDPKSYFPPNCGVTMGAIFLPVQNAL